MKELFDFPCWYANIAILFTAFHVIRGFIAYRNSQGYNKTKTLYNWIVIHIHDFLLHTICTLFGFVVLYLAYKLFPECPNSMTFTDAAIIFSLVLVGIAGITGQLAVMLAQAKLPGIKS